MFIQKVRKYGTKEIKEIKSNFKGSCCGTTWFYFQNLHDVYIENLFKK